MNKIKEIQRINKKELEGGVSGSASWHAAYKHSAYIFAGGLPYKLNEHDVITVFSQFGEVVDCNLIRHKETGKSRGFAFIAYEDQRSTVLAVDNFNGAKVLGRAINVDHVMRYRKPTNDDAAEAVVDPNKPGDVEESDETYDARRKKIWDYEAYLDTDAPSGVKEDYETRKVLRSDEDKRQANIESQILERKQRRSQLNEQHHAQSRKVPILPRNDGSETQASQVAHSAAQAQTPSTGLDNDIRNLAKTMRTKKKKKKKKKKNKNDMISAFGFKSGSSSSKAKAANVKRGGGGGGFGGGKSGVVLMTPSAKANLKSSKKKRRRSASPSSSSSSSSRHRSRKRKKRGKRKRR